MMITSVRVYAKKVYLSSKQMVRRMS